MEGSVRRFDDLGRIVIPKEIRRNIFDGRGNVEGEMMLITVDNNKIILERYFPTEEEK